MSKQVILTGLRANNDLHIGNYFGALLPIIDMAKRHSGEYDIHLFIPDLHSFITPIDHTVLRQSVLHNASVYAAAGLPLDNPAIHLYRQSYVPAHSELTWILDCFTGMGEMGRMTQYKDKSARLGDEHINVGLFNYPVLMAADILLYGARYVPVGEDQTQHLEFTRDIAERMNSRFGELFTMPEPVAKQHEFFGKDQGLRIKDLLEPGKKMSKSDETGKGVVFMNDPPETAAKKIMSATTDDKACVRYDKAAQPGIANLLEILTLTRQASSEHPEDTTLEQVCQQYDGQDRYGDFKRVVAEEVATFLTAFQKRLATVDTHQVQNKLISSETAMNEVANATLLRVQQAVGLR